MSSVLFIPSPTEDEKYAMETDECGAWATILTEEDALGLGRSMEKLPSFTDTIELSRTTLIHLYPPALLSRESWNLNPTRFTK